MERDETFNSRNSGTKFKIGADKENVNFKKKETPGGPFLRPLPSVMERSGLHLTPTERRLNAAVSPRSPVPPLPSQVAVVQWDWTPLL